MRMRVTWELFPFPPLLRETKQIHVEGCCQNTAMSFNDIVAALEKDTLKFSLKSEQLSLLRHACKGNNTFGILPTGYGKSECFGLFPLIMDQVSTITFNAMKM